MPRFIRISAILNVKKFNVHQVTTIYFFIYLWNCLMWWASVNTNQSELHSWISTFHNTRFEFYVSMQLLELPRSKLWDILMKLSRSGTSWINSQSLLFCCIFNFVPLIMDVPWSNVHNIFLFFKSNWNRQILAMELPDEISSWAFYSFVLAYY